MIKNPNFLPGKLLMFIQAFIMYQLFFSVENLEDNFDKLTKNEDKDYPFLV